MTNKFDELTDQQISEPDTSSPYLPDSNMLKKGYDYDSSGLYKPYRFKYENNPDQREIYFKIERIPNQKTKSIIYSWNYRTNGEFKRLNFFRRDILPVEEEIESGGKASINKKLAHTGRIAGLNSEKGSYKNFMEDLIMDIVQSDKLEVFKDLEYEFPIDDMEDMEDDELSESEIISEIETRKNPPLTDEQMAEALEVKSEINEIGLIPYYNNIFNKFHVGIHKSITKKHLGGFNIIRGRGSYYIRTTAKSEAGKTLEDTIAFLLMIPEDYIFKKNQMSLSAFSRYSDISIYYFDRMIIYFGDLGNKKSYEKIEDVFDAIKILITDKVFSRDLTEGNSSARENKTLELKAESIGAVFQTVEHGFGDEEGDQLTSRTIDSSPTESNEDEVLDFLFALNYWDSKENKAQESIKEEVLKYHNYLLYLIKEDIKVINPFRSFFKKYVRNSQTKFRDFTQILELFDAYCVLTHGKCDEINGKLIASEDQVKSFIDDICLENTLPPVESNFIKMILAEGNKTELKILSFKDNENPIEEYEENAMYELGYYQSEKRYNSEGEEYIRHYETIGDLDFSKRQSTIAKMLELYRLGGKGNNHVDNIFFRIPDLQRLYGSQRSFKDVGENVGNFLNKLYSNMYLDKLEYKDNNGRNIYYLTPKCKEISEAIELEDDDIKDSNKFMEEQGIKKAES